jgi:hypothetical protein
VDADYLADELYALPPEQFTAARALRKPTVLAWLVNLLVQELPDEIGGFLN